MIKKSKILSFNILLTLRGGITMQTKFNLRIFLILISLLMIISCAPTKFASQWNNDSYTGGHLKKVLVVGLSKNLYNRKLFEDVFTEKFKKKGTDAVPSYSVILTFKDLNKDTVLNQAEKLGVDTILVTQLLGVKEEYIHYEPLDYNPYKGTSAFSRHFAGSSKYAYANKSVTYTKMESVRLQTNLYQKETEELLWTSVTETFHPESVKEVIDSLSKAVMGSLRTNKLVR
jgi:hypothetical protein